MTINILRGEEPKAVFFAPLECILEKIEQQATNEKKESLPSPKKLPTPLPFAYD